MWHVYFRSGQFLVPTVARADAGFYLDIGPVQTVLAGDRAQLERVLADVIARGNPPIETPSRANFPDPVVLAPAGVRSWSGFERKSICWTISEVTAPPGFEIRVSGRAAHGGWAGAPEHTQRVPADLGAAGIAGVVLEHLASRRDVCRGGPAARARARAGVETTPAAPPIVVPHDLRRLLGRHGRSALRSAEDFLRGCPRRCLYATAERTDPLPLRRGFFARLFGSKQGAPRLPATASKLGGISFRAAGERATDDYLFLGQLNFAELPPLDGFPRRGVLAFDMSSKLLWSHASFARVRWYPDPTEPAPAGSSDVACVGDFEAALRFVEGWSLPEGDAWTACLPPGDDELRDAWRSWEPDGYREDQRPSRHRIGGHPTQARFDNYGEPVPADRELVLRLDSDDAAGLRWGSNAFYLLVAASDLAVSRLDRAVGVMANF